MQSRTIRTLLWLTFLISSHSLMANTPVGDPPEIKKLELPKITGRRIQSNSGCDSKKYLNRVYEQSTSIFVARIVEAIPTDILETTRSKSNKYFLHLWLKNGWKKPTVRKLDLEIDYYDLMCVRPNEGQIKANRKYLIYLKGNRILDYIDFSDLSDELASQHAQHLGDEKWYFNRVNNLVISGG